MDVTVSGATELSFVGISVSLILVAQVAAAG